MAFLDLLTESIGNLLKHRGHDAPRRMAQAIQALAEKTARVQQLQLPTDQCRVAEKAQPASRNRKPFLGPKCETKNREVEQAKPQLEEKAEKLAAHIKVQSEFLANMSHDCARRSSKLADSGENAAENFRKEFAFQAGEIARRVTLRKGLAEPHQRTFVDLSRRVRQMDAELESRATRAASGYCCARPSRRRRQGLGLHHRNWIPRWADTNSQRTPSACQQV